MFKRPEQIGPDIKIVGNIPTEEKLKEKERILGLFGEKHLSEMPADLLEDIRKLEYPKTKEEIMLIALANQKTNQLMEEAGLEPFDVPEKNFHIVPPELFKKIFQAERGAVTDVYNQAIFLDAAVLRGKLLEEAETLFHELWHLKSFCSFEVQDKAAIIEKEGVEMVRMKRKRAVHRAGLKVQASLKQTEAMKEHEHFRGLAEAVAAWQGKEFIQELINNPLFAKEKEWLSSEECVALRKEIAQNNSIEEEEIFWVGRDGEWWTYDYPRQRKVLDYAISEIAAGAFEKFLKKYPQDKKLSFGERIKMQRFFKEKALSEFTNGTFTGRLLPLARLMKNTFGPLGFRILGQMGDDKETPTATLELLRKARLQQMEKSKK